LEDLRLGGTISRRAVRRALRRLEAGCLVEITRVPGQLLEVMVLDVPSANPSPILVKRAVLRAIRQRDL
jgi:hypothetical protein